MYNINLCKTLIRISCNIQIRKNLEQKKLCENSKGNKIKSVLDIAIIIDKNSDYDINICYMILLK